MCHRLCLGRQKLRGSKESSFLIYSVTNETNYQCTQIEIFRVEKEHYTLQCKELEGNETYVCSRDDCYAWLVSRNGVHRLTGGLHSHRRDETLIAQRVIKKQLRIRVEKNFDHLDTIYDEFLRAFKPNIPERNDGNRGRGRPGATKTAALTNELQISGLPGGKKHNFSFRLPMRSSSMLDLTRRIEPETNDNELDLLYDKYLQTQLELMIIEQKTKAREKDLLSELAGSSTRFEESEQKFHKLKVRVEQVINLIELQEKLDPQIVESDKTLKNYKRDLNDLFPKIRSIINDLKGLFCDNIKLPETQNEMKLFQSSIEKISGLMSALEKNLNGKASIIDEAKIEINVFIDTQEIFKKKLEILTESIRNLEVDMLYGTSAELATHSPS